jgi:NTE family protein
MKRRTFLSLLAAGSLLTACKRLPEHKRVGVALGGGGAKGLAHIGMLEVLDELNIRPHRIAGTSIGAVIGALYASGMSGQDIRKLVNDLTVNREESWFEALFSQDIMRWLEFIEIRLGNGGLIDSSAFINYLQSVTTCETFSDLEIPLQVVATDFWSRDQVVFDKGQLWPAIQASIAVPGLFNPIHHGKHVLVDGGLVNPVPYDLLMDDCDLVIAIDVLGEQTPDTDDGPSYFETTFNSFQIMQSSIMREKRLRLPPDIYIQPDIQDIRVLEFYKFEIIDQQSLSARKHLRRKLEQLGFRA